MTARPVVVLVEGRSDALVVEHLLGQHSLAGRLDVVPMGGVTNIRHHVRRLAGGAARPVVLGLCDAGERRFLEAADPPLDGVFVCDRDLEEELIRAVGPDRVLEVLDELDDLGRFRTFQGQPEWRGRPVTDQLRRFAGTRSGRKDLLARALARSLDPDRVPAPLADLVERVRSVVG